MSVTKITPSGLPSLNVDDPLSFGGGDDDVVIPSKRSRRDDSFVPSDGVTFDADPTPFSTFVRSVNDGADEQRGPGLARNIRLNLDNSSVDDLLLEKSMLVKWLITRYKNAPAVRIRKPRDLMFAIIECVCTGIEIYLSTEGGDCRYIDRVDVFDGSIFCSCNEWMLGFVGESEAEPDTRDDSAPIVVGKSVTERVLDNINIFEGAGHREGEAIAEEFSNFFSWNSSDDGGLPPLLRQYGEDDPFDGGDGVTAAFIPFEKRIERARNEEREKMQADARKLGGYVNLNASILSETANETEDRGADRGASTDRRKRETTLRLIVDTKELERLLTFLLYVDREALYGDIDVTFKSKLGDGRSICIFDNATKLSGDVKTNCLGEASGDAIKDLFENIADDRRYRDESIETDYERDDRSKRAPDVDRAFEIFEYAALLFLDKISTVVVENLLVAPESTGRVRGGHGHTYKFGVVDLIHPKIGKTRCHKIPTSSSAPYVRASDENVYNRKRGTVISFDDREDR